MSCVHEERRNRSIDAVVAITLAGNVVPEIPVDAGDARGHVIVAGFNEPGIRKSLSGRCN